MRFSPRLCLVLIVLVLIGDEFVRICDAKRGGGGFGRGSSSSYARRRKPISSSSYRSKYSRPAAPRQPSAPPAPQTPFKQSSAVSGLNSAPKSTQVDQSKPIGWNIPASNAQPKQQSVPVSAPAPYPNQPPPTYNGGYQPAYQPPPAYSPPAYSPPAYSPHQPPPPSYYNPAPGSYQPNAYNPHSFGGTGSFQPPKRSGFGLGSLAGSSTLGNALTALTLWQVIKGNSYRGGYGGYGGAAENSAESGAKTVNIYNNYYNGSAVAINEPIANTDNVPIKTRFENGTLVLQDDTVIYPNGTLVLNNGTVFNTVADIPTPAPAAAAAAAAASAPVTLAPILLTSSLLPAIV